VIAGLAVTAAVAVIIGTALYAATRSTVPEHPPGAHRGCSLCRTESRVAPWKRRAMQARQPGPGWAARVRYALTEGEYRERRRFGMPMTHPDWLTGLLPEAGEELLAELDASLETGDGS